MKGFVSLELPTVITMRSSPSVKRELAVSVIHISKPYYFHRSQIEMSGSFVLHVCSA
jgi:hypothetical protein